MWGTVLLTGGALMLTTATGALADSPPIVPAH
jgi:hypothetical protein